MPKFAATHLPQKTFVKNVNDGKDMRESKNFVLNAQLQMSEFK